MKKVQLRQTIIAMLIIIMFLIGMCLDSMQADSYWLHDNDICFFHNNIENQSLSDRNTCSNEVAGIFNSTNILYVVRTESGRRGVFSTCYSCGTYSVFHACCWL